MAAVLAGLPFLWETAQISAHSWVRARRLDRRSRRPHRHRYTYKMCALDDQPYDGTDLRTDPQPPSVLGNLHQPPARERTGPKTAASSRSAPAPSTPP